MVTCNCCVLRLLLQDVAAVLAAEYSTSGTIEFKVTGTSEDGQASGLFGAGDVLVLYGVTLTSGTFEVNLTSEFDLAGEALTFADAYVKWAPDTLSVTMKLLGIDKELYDIAGMAYGGDPADIPSNPGLGFEVPVVPFTFDLVVNNQKETVGDAYSLIFHKNCVFSPRSFR